MRRTVASLILVSLIAGMSTLFVPHTVYADWKCKNVPFIVNGSVTYAWRCVEDTTQVGDFKSLRECLRGAAFNDPEVVGGNNCVQDPRYVMRNFAALNFWSIGKALNIAIPLATLGAAGLCLVFLLAGAYTYITSAGEQKKITESTNRMVYSILGLILVILAYAIVRAILYMTRVNTVGL